MESIILGGKVSMKNAYEKSQEMKGKINPRYDLNTLDIQDIVENTVDIYGAICAAFKFGYLKGSRATKKEMLKGVEVEV